MLLIHVEMVTDDNWAYPYTRKEAAFPVNFRIADKYWPPVTKIDDAYGDRNLICTCAPISDLRREAEIKFIYQSELS